MGKKKKINAKYSPEFKISALSGEIVFFSTLCSYTIFENFYLYFLSKNTLFHICLKLDTKNLNKIRIIAIKRNKII